MTYKELALNTVITIKEKQHDEERRRCKKVKYTVIGKYPGMCVAVDGNGMRRGIAVGELY